MKGIQNFLLFINENYVSILVCIGLIIGIIEKTRAFFRKSKEERYEIAKQQIRETMLKKITNAENDFAEWEKSGSIKRSQVIDEIYAQYPILNKIANQDEVIAWIDNEIDNSLKTLRNVVNKNRKEID